MTSEPHAVTVELMGTIRRQGGTDRLVVSAATLRQVLAAIQHRLPTIGSKLIVGEQLGKGILVSIDGTLFVDNLDRPIETGETVLILDRDAGG